VGLNLLSSSHFGRADYANTGWSYDWVMGGLAVSLLVGGAISPRVGRAIARYSGRVVLAGGSFLIAIGLTLMSMAATVPIYLAAWAIVGLGMGAGLYDAALSTPGSLYGDTARRSITSVTLFGGFASTVCWPFTAWLFPNVGWRDACVTYAAIHVVGAVLYLLLLPSVRSRANGQQLPRGSLRLITSEKLLFALLMGVLTISAAILSLMGSQLITLLLASGIGLSKSVALGMIIGPAAVGARVVERLLGERHHPIWTMVASALLVACGATLFLMGAQAFAPAIAVYAAGNGIGSIAKGTLPLALFGPARYPLIMGALGLPILFAMSLAPYAGAWSFQIGGVTALLSLLAVLAASNVVLVIALYVLAKRSK
jgi:MFS family permease